MQKNKLTVLLLLLLIAALLSCSQPQVISIQDYSKVRPLQAVLANWPNPSYTIVHYTDTHSHYDEVTANLKWLIDNKEIINPKVLLNTGDIVNNPAVEPSWPKMAEIMSMLDGEIPWLVTPGNHDYDNNYAGDRSLTLYDKYFPVSSFDEQEGLQWGDTFDGTMRDWYCFFDDWIVIGLDFGPEREEVDWANRLLTTHSNKLAILGTHVYMFHDDTRVGPEDRTNPKDYPIDYGIPNAYDGEDLWRELVSKHSNIVMVLSGHITGAEADKGCFYGYGTGRRTDYVGEQPVNCALANYQMCRSKYMRMYRIEPDKNIITAITVNAMDNKWLVDDDNYFVWEFRK